MKSLVISIAIIFCAITLSACLDLTSDTSRDIKIIDNSVTPNQSYVATSYRMMGGGAAGWCYTCVNVRRNSEQFNPDSGIIFQTRCDVEPELKWQDEKRLSVAYQRDAAVYSQEKAWGGSEGVEVSYVPK